MVGGRRQLVQPEDKGWEAKKPGLDISSVGRALKS